MTSARTLNTEAVQLYEQVLAKLAEFEAARADGSREFTPPALAILARDYDSATTEQRRAELIDTIVQTVTLDEAGIIRRAADAIGTAIPEIVNREKARGVPTSRIADTLGVTPSYVRRRAREHNAARAGADEGRRQAADQIHATTWHERNQGPSDGGRAAPAPDANQQ
ncbi:hypothetical protein ACFWGL_17060 [Streptomyces sp. NPDC060286]|uniref:hypothetical protein n=1 Tax=unclassified Streptomyces TaxID=2593676 RepID=UPI0035D71EBA